MALVPATSVGGSSTAAVWTTAFSEDGTSLANWTQVVGAWSVVSNALHVDTTGGTMARLKFNTAQDAGYVTDACLEADVMIESSGLVNNSVLGFLPYFDGTSSTGNFCVQLIESSGHKARAEMDQVAGVLAPFLPAPTWAPDVYSKLRIVKFGPGITIVLDGKFIAHTPVGDAYASTVKGFTAAPFVGLMANNCKANFKNIKLSYVALP